MITYSVSLEIIDFNELNVSFVSFMKTKEVTTQSGEVITKRNMVCTDLGTGLKRTEITHFQMTNGIKLFDVDLTKNSSRTTRTSSIK